MNKEDKTIERLTFENYIWVIYIIISVVTIIGDELIKTSIKNHDNKKDKLASNIFTITLIVTLIIYIYFLNRNYNDYKEHNDTNYFIRLFGSILVFVGTICFLYFQINTSSVEESVSNI